MKFLNHPNIPEGSVRLCAIASGYPEMKQSLNNRGIEVLEIDPLNILQTPVCAHADMQLHDLGGGRVVVAKGANKLIQALKGYGFEVLEQELGRYYPQDVKLNCFSLNGNLFCNKKSTSEKLLNVYQSKGGSIINIKQGYAKCSTCIVDEACIITSDPSIAKAAKENGVDVLVIQCGEISLPGYDTGLIGGCCGLISRNELAFTGKISLHTDCGRIKSFLLKRGIEIVELTKSRLFDPGGILPLAIE